MHTTAGRSKKYVCDSRAERLYANLPTLSATAFRRGLPAFHLGSPTSQDCDRRSLARSGPEVHWGLYLLETTNRVFEANGCDASVVRIGVPVT